MRVPQASNRECIKGEDNECVMRRNDSHTCRVGLAYWAQMSDISDYEMEYWVRQVTAKRNQLSGRTCNGTVGYSTAGHGERRRKHCGSEVIG